MRARITAAWLGLIVAVPSRPHVAQWYDQILLRLPQTRQ